MNAILHDSYSTVHITPEESCSYASFETNARLANYAPLVRNTLRVFRPTRFVLTVFGEDADLGSLTESLPSLRQLDIPGQGRFVRTSLSSTKLDSNQGCHMACYCLEPLAPLPLTPSVSASSLAAAAEASPLVAARLGRSRSYSFT